MVIVLEAPEQLIYYLDSRTRTSGSAGLVQVLYSGGPSGN